MPTNRDRCCETSNRHASRQSQAFRSIVGEDAKQGLIDLAGRIEIMSETGDLLDVIPFAEAVEVRLGEERR